MIELTVQQTNVIYGCLIAAIIFLAAAAVWGLLRLFRFHRRKRGGFDGVLLLYLLLIVAIWCLRYSVGYYNIVKPQDIVDGEPSEMLTTAEEIFNSVIHALQTFSMDEDYTDYIIDGREMMTVLFGSNSAAVTWYGIVAMILNVIAPIAGGAIIFEILANIFPTIRIFISGILVWCEKYYFSELNEQSLALINSVCDSQVWWRPKPVIIITDVYRDNDNESKTEMLLEAKQRGAICVREDLAHVKKARLSKKKFFLMDESETANLEAYINLSDKNNCKYLKRSEVYFFSQNDVYTEVEHQVREKLLSEMHFAQTDLPIFIPIQFYRNLATNLLMELPLYEPVVHKVALGKEYELSLTILGNGIIGTEMFLNAYWLGQMLNCRLNINIVSKDEIDVFRKKIDYINPEIIGTVIFNGDGEEKKQILRYNDGDNGFSAPYAYVHYYQSDVKSGSFWENDSDVTKTLLKTDYFVIALGNDVDNISVAKNLQRFVGEEHAKTRSADKTVIAYVVYDSELCRTLNIERHFASWNKNAPDIYMKAFGCLDDVYSYENIFMTKGAVQAREVGMSYSLSHNEKDYVIQNVKRSSDIDNDYKFWANIARAMHLKYKVFSLGWIKDSVFGLVNESADDDAGDIKELIFATAAETESKHKNNVAAACALYKRIVIYQGEYPDKADAEYEKQLADASDRLAWLEHRRWNAYTRSRGFRGTTAYLSYFGATGSYKHMSLKLHPCLVECGWRGMNPAVTDGEILPDITKGETLPEITDELTLPDADVWASFDYLDRLSYTLYRKLYLKETEDENKEKKLTVERINGYDFKMYDYPHHEYETYCTVDEAAARLSVKAGCLVKRCDGGKVSGAVHYPESKVWVIPQSYIDEKLKNRK